MTTQEYVEWLAGPLLSGLYPTEYYNGDPIPPSRDGYILNYLVSLSLWLALLHTIAFSPLHSYTPLQRLVGGVQLRQLRVGNQSCFSRRYTEFGSRYDTLDGTCFAAFQHPKWYNFLWTKSTEETQPYGPPGNG